MRKSCFCQITKFDLRRDASIYEKEMDTGAKNSTSSLYILENASKNKNSIQRRGL